MNGHFNNLTPAQAERIAMLAEEAGEIVQMCGKILRHGLDSYHPMDADKTPNRELLRRELMDLDAVKSMMTLGQDIRLPDVEGITAALNRKRHYTHHQGHRS